MGQHLAGARHATTGVSVTQGDKPPRWPGAKLAVPVTLRPLCHHQPAQGWVHPMGREDPVAITVTGDAQPRSRGGGAVVHGDDGVRGER